MTQPRSPSTQVRVQRSLPVWAKLWTLVILANIGGFAVSIFVAGTIRAIPSSSGTEKALLFGYYAAMVVVAILDAFLLDEVFFKGGFRKTYIQGRVAQLSTRGGKSDSMADVAAGMRRTTMGFPFLILVCGGLTYTLFNVVNRDFDTYYQRVGQHVVAMHIGTPDEQIAAVQTLSIRREPQVLPELKWRLEHGGEAAVWAAWSLGRFTDLPTRRPLKAPLAAAARSEDPKVRREALVALGRIQHRAADSAIHNEIRAQRDRDEAVDGRLMYALGSIQTLSSVPLLEDLLHTARAQTQRLAAWALAQHRDQRGGRKVVKILEARLPTASHEVRCALVHSLGILADEQSNLALMDTYDRATPAERATLCARTQLSMRPDGDHDDRVDLFMPQDAFAMKVILSMAQMRATSAEVRARAEPWLQRLIDDEETTPAARESARGLLAGIKSGRDDNTNATVEEALGI
ncbi:MAG: HEAT repeat domain-containing protein [Nannocystaceae bacterium]|nr:HEAT repeat domain-containing protein [Nannocystaceae bacterium]